MASDDTNPPAFSVEVGATGAPLDIGITQFVSRVEYEVAEGLASMAKIHLANPDFTLSALKVFEPGNELFIRFGYGTQLKGVGRVIIKKVRDNYPQNEMPGIEVTAYTKDSNMMDHSPEKSKKKGGKGGRVFKNQKFSDAVAERASDYDMELDIDPTPTAATDFVQKAGMTDFEFIRGLANLCGFLFWVDGDDKGKWTLHFKDPEKDLNVQDREFIFRYNLGDLSTLLNFESEYAITGSATKLKVEVKDPETGKLLSTEVEEEGEEPDIEATGDETEKTQSALVSGAAVKLYFGDFSFGLETGKRFKTEAEVQAWAKQWFRRHRENFLLGSGSLIGVESLTARQIHTLDGLARPTLNGRYYFTRVRHVLDVGSGYTCQFNARKVV